MSEFKRYNIANYYEDINGVGRNDGAPLYMTEAFRRLGHNVTHLIPDNSIYNFGKFDLNLWVDWGEDALKDVLRNDGKFYTPVECPKPNVYWTSDTHLGYDYRLNKAKEFDTVFCAQKRAVEEFGRSGVKAKWLPHAAEPTCYKPFSIIKKYDVCFVGHLCNNKRIDFLDIVFKEFPNFWYGQKKFEDAAKIFCQSKIVLNTAALDDVNMRVFEALSTKSFLITEDVPTLHELFTDTVHLVTYSDVYDAIDKINYYLAHEEKRNEIAEMGYNAVLSSHTYRHRAETILKHTLKGES